MTNEIVITGARPYDGRYPLDLDLELTTREWGWIKRLAGYLPLAVDEQAFGDPELVCAIAVIAMRRAGRLEINEVPKAYDVLVDAPFGSSITIDTDEPDQEEATEEPDPPASSSSNGATTGTSSPPDSVTPETPPSPTGNRGSGTSRSGPRTSVT